jgi:hypothetical protein
MYETIALGFALFAVAEATHDCYWNIDGELYVMQYPATPEP